MSPDELVIAENYHQKKKISSHQRGIEYSLTFDELMCLISDAGISPSDIGSSATNYCLARKNEITNEIDSGDYVIGNCRFITMSENVSESQRGENNHMFGKVGKLHPNYDKPISEEQKKKISNSNVGGPTRDWSEEQRIEVSDRVSGDKHPMSGKCHSEETRNKMSLSQKGKSKPDGFAEKCRMSRNRAPTVTCPHCHQVGKGGNFTRHHFDKCKQRGE